MPGGHDHAGDLTATGRHRGRLMAVMAISAGIAIAEIAGSLAANQGAAMLNALQGCLRGHFDVVHSTFQLEPAGHAGHEPSVCL